MKRIRRLLVLIDDWQRASRSVGLIYAVIKKFGDDNANQFVVALGWYGFVAIYPLLLVVITIFGFIGAASLGHDIVSTLHEFPVIGSQFNPERSSQSLQGSGLGLAIGLIGLIYGAQGVTQTVQQAMAGVWNVPQVDRPGFVPRLARSLVSLAIIGAAFVLNAAAGTFVTNAGVSLPSVLSHSWSCCCSTPPSTWQCFVLLLRAELTAADLLPGAALASLGFTLLITIGSGLVQHQLRHSSATYGQFGLVIGLVGFLFLLAKISLYGAELNPVVSRHLWPRGMLQDDPTEADNQVLSDIAHQYRLRDDQRIGVGFGENAAEEAGDEARRREPA